MDWFQGRNPNFGHIDLAYKEQRQMEPFKTINDAKMVWDLHSKPKQC